MKRLCITVFFIIIEMIGVISLMLIGFFPHHIVQYVFVIISLPTIVIPAALYLEKYFTNLFK